MNKNLHSFEAQYRRLNPEQKLAVDMVDGPVLVVAGPGTGKTQLLSARVANILQQTDTAPSNILCLTFTDSGALNMRSRLREFLGESAYDVTISTYHSFGSEIIKNYGSYFQQIRVDRTDDIRLERPIDEVIQINILENIIGNLPYDNSLLATRYYLKDLVSTISDLKTHLITPEKVRMLGRQNLAQIEIVQPILDELFNNSGGISRKKSELVAQYASLLKSLSSLSGSLLVLAHSELRNAYDLYESLNKSTPLTNWKNKWLHKNRFDKFTLTDPALSEKMLELAEVYDAYEKSLRNNSLYDFDDMILRAIEGIKNSDELRYNLQERYQYILLDEFQDTNPSQFALVKIIADHPVHEGRPNLMAVGDDDQAIFSFQGANIGNIQDFLNSYRDVKIINLTHNYRSHQDILHLSRNISNQISNRLHTQLTGIDKLLVASSNSLPPSSKMMRHVFDSVASEYDWVSEHIAQLIKNGVAPKTISVIAPKHNLLENLVPFLKLANIPISYEKRENILETEIIRTLYLSSRLLVALSTKNNTEINEYLSQVISLPFWNNTPSEIWRTNWQFAKHDESRSWAEIALANPALSDSVNFYLTLSNSITTLSLEVVLDQLIGISPVTVAGKEFISPFKEFYFNQTKRLAEPLLYYESLGHLSLIRTRLVDYQTNQAHSLMLTDFINFYSMYESAGEMLINTHPIASATDSVQLMTAYKAKGQEFDHVFILQSQDDVWGSTSRGSGNKLALPLNLAHIRYVDSGDDERLRLFYVALTRARHGLYLTSHLTKDNGKPTLPIKYLNEGDGVSPHFPVTSQKIISSPSVQTKLAKNIATLWSAGRVTLPVNIRDLLSDQLDKYQMSPTHLNTYLDLTHAGPEEFLNKTLLRFPVAPNESSEYGQLIHNTLEWYQSEIKDGKQPAISSVLSHYDTELIRLYLTPPVHTRLADRGKNVLERYLQSRADMFALPAVAEVNFSHEGVVLEDARLTGKIDRLEIDYANKTLHIVDFKTGSPLTKWGTTLKSYKYRHQLYFYKLLLEGSHTWRGYTVTDARLEFLEPTAFKNGTISSPLYITFDKQSEQNFKKLINVIWRKILTLDFPSTSSYSQDLAGTLAFEQDLLKED